MLSRRLSDASIRSLDRGVLVNGTDSFAINLNKHQQSLVDSQKMNQSLKKCLDSCPRAWQFREAYP